MRVIPNGWRQRQFSVIFVRFCSSISTEPIKAPKKLAGKSVSSLTVERCALESALYLEPEYMK
jgi:hypothetical protein